MDLNALKKIYFIGIGGIGMSALARYFNRRGSEIHGYDKTETTLTKKLVKEGMTIHYEDNVDLIPAGIDIVVYTPAIPGDHKELTFLREGHVPVLKRSEVLGIISRAKKCIAIAGTHGKTTTSSMTAHLLKYSGLDISCFLGGIANNFNSNYCYGENDWTVIEADEFDRSFHTLNPEIAVLISMDPDHLDIYGAKEKMQESFETFLLKINPGGKAIIQRDLIQAFDQDFLEKLDEKRVKIYTYGKQDADFVVEKIEYDERQLSFDFVHGNDDVEALEMMMPGEHNAENMCAAIAIARLIGVGNKMIRRSVESFSGIKRRFDVFHAVEMVYVDDYAHHPSELKAAIGSARKLWPRRKLTVIFQPHLFSRTNDFMDDFCRELAEVDELILMEIYPARELPMEGVTSSVLLGKIENEKKSLVQKKDLMAELKNKKIEVLMTLGAGDIDVFVPQIREWLAAYD